MISPSIGYFESRLFNPEDYAQLVPNLAFQKATELDGFWGAKIVMSFTNEQIRAIVETGKYEKQGDEDYIAKTLIERRDKTGRYWYSRVNPLDNFRFADADGTNGYSKGTKKVIQFDDLAVQAGFEDASKTSYQYKLQYHGKDLMDLKIGRNPSISLTAEMNRIAEQFFTEKGDLSEDDKILTFKIRTRRGKVASWGKDVKVHFYYPYDNEKQPQIIAVEREN